MMNFIEIAKHSYKKSVSLLPLKLVDVQCTSYVDDSKDVEYNLKVNNIFHDNGSHTE